MQFLARLEMDSLFLAGLQRQEMDTVLAAATQRHYSANTVITREGAAASHFFLLAKGRARYFLNTPGGQKILLLWVAPGGVIGGGALTLNMPNYMASVEAVRDSVVLCWTRASIRELAQRYPRLLNNSLSVSVEYMKWAMDTLVGLTSHTACERLAYALVGLSRIIGQKSSVGMALDVTNEELAGAANISPYTTSRLLGRWREQGLVSKHRGKIVLHAPDKLLSRCV